MGSMMSGGAAKSTTSTNMGPWQAQQSYLTNGFSQGQNALNSALGTPKYTGPFAAAQNADEKAATQGMSNFATGQGQNIANQFTGQGGSLLGNYNQAANIASKVGNMAGQDPTKQIIGNAGQYADNPYLQGQINSGMQDIKQQMNLTNAGSDAAASAGGNLDSTRAGVTNALNNQFAMRNASALESNMRGSAYNNGLTMAQGQYNQGIQNQLGAAQSLANIGGQGANLLNQGYGLNQQNFQTQLGAGQFQQGQDQAQIQGSLAKDQYDTSRDMGIIQNYMKIVGGNYGQSGTSSTTSTPATPSPFQTILGTAATLGGAALTGGGSLALQGAMGGLGSLFGGGGVAPSSASAILGGGGIGNTTVANPFYQSQG